MPRPPITHQDSSHLRTLLICLVASGAVLWLAQRYSANKPEPKPYRLPTPELAAMNRDIQARFAVVPEKDFGIERTYGLQHYLYNPQTPTEVATVTALKKERTEVALYLMSRALWLRQWDGWGYKPIQGPVMLTDKISAPLPRRINFGVSVGGRMGEIVDQDGGYGADSTIQGGSISAHNPDGSVVPTPRSPQGAPTFNQLQAIGNRVFESAELAPKTMPVGVSEALGSQWKVAAVTIRAEKKACLPCHTYDWPKPPNSKAPRQTKAQLGDALGVAFYLYRTKVASPSTPQAKTSLRQRAKPEATPAH